jgi:hypothetical protein
VPTAIQGETSAIEVLWSGDSRAYSLDPAGGLRQLTRDHISDASDAGGTIGGDSPMTRCLSADDVALDVHQPSIPMPGVVLAATDGCFAYVASPMHFELLLLDHLAASSDAADWGRRLHDQILGFTGDDATMVLVAVGFADHAAVQAAFAPRHAFLARHIEVTVLGGADDLDRLWRWYRHDFLEHCPPAEVVGTVEAICREPALQQSDDEEGDAGAELQGG